MIKKIIGKSLMGFAMGVTAGQIVTMIIACIAGNPDFVPLVPDFREHFSSVTIALGTHNLLVGIISAVFAGSTAVFERERWSFLKQCIIYFIITAVVWIPISIFCWTTRAYPQAGIQLIISFSFSYFITYIIQYHICKAAINQINQRVEEMNGEENSNE